MQKQKTSFKLYIYKHIYVCRKREKYRKIIKTREKREMNQQQLFNNSLFSHSLMRARKQHTYTKHAVNQTASDDIRHDNTWMSNIEPYTCHKISQFIKQ